MKGVAVGDPQVVEEDVLVGDRPFTARKVPLNTATIEDHRVRRGVVSSKNMIATSCTNPSTRDHYKSTSSDGSITS